MPGRGQVAPGALLFHTVPMRWLLAVLLFVVPAWAGTPIPSSSACGPAIDAAERAHRTAPGLLAAIGLVESGRRDAGTHMRAPWPWTVTAEGIGTFYPSKLEAIRAVQALQGRGVASIDVGCMQVNLLQHPGAFSDLGQAFDPASNAGYAASFLVSLFNRLGGWPAATAAYHSLTPALGMPYARLVAAVWSGAPLPVVDGPGGVEIVQFPGGGQMRILRDAVGPGRVLGFLSGP